MKWLSFNDFGHKWLQLFQQNLTTYMEKEKKTKKNQLAKKFAYIGDSNPLQ